jgi:hypothetical protein
LFSSRHNSQIQKREGKKKFSLTSEKTAVAAQSKSTKKYSVSVSHGHEIFLFSRENVHLISDVDVGFRNKFITFKEKCSQNRRI